MRVIPPDFDRRAELPGAGATPCPVDIGPEATGFADLLSLRVHEVEEGAVIQGGSGGDDLLIVLLAGAVAIGVEGPHEATVRLDADGDWALHLPPRHLYRLEPLVPATLACARARPVAEGGVPRAYRPLGGLLSVEGEGLGLRLRVLELEGATDASAGLDPDTERLVHLTGPARVRSGGEARELPPAHTLALSPGETAQVTGEGEALVLAAVRTGVRPAAAP
ncbi:hypothetical protein [Rubellimicrobium aerolatum]|uniref:Quercetin 2,3-dioxygenase C-terminal cupin domain-containing protein n=1 Tax=Rubellimicrobium aerolatum TaxID=490979 RepID=A0ABW0SF55_9RHOB|nr:hypothetical protein [Rubellimicrobium aerolatum]MBP1807066.1 hypothetical protein [Rubellimicrobium aerolatum]